MRFDFYAFIAEAEQRKRELGLSDDDATVEALRNKGGTRTPRKRALLEGIDQRARKAGRKAISAHF